MENKSILVIDTPTNCYECPLIYWGNIGGWNCKPTRALLDDANRKPEWCPLRQLPEWKDVPEYLETNRDWEAWGFDQCLTEILGDAEGETE